MVLEILGEVSDEFIADFKINLIKVIREEAFPLLKERLLDAYDQLASEEESQMGASVSGRDPLSLSNWKFLFEKQIDKELDEISLQGDQLNLSLGAKDLLGFGNPGRTGDPETVDWLSYYIEGMIGEFAFITPEQYEARGRHSNNPLGRLGGGFLMPRRRYELERWERVTGLPFDAVKHSISGQRPFKGFEEVGEKFDFSPFVDKALARTAARINKNM